MFFSYILEQATNRYKTITLFAKCVILADVSYFFRLLHKVIPDFETTLRSRRLYEQKTERFMVSYP